MSLAWVILALVPAVAQVTSPRATVYFGSEGTASTAVARRFASAVLLKAGVALTWAKPRPGGLSPDAIRIDLVEDAGDQRFPGSLAVSYPGAACSTGITVFADRVHALAGNPARESALLGYVVAHEVAHVLQALNRHSPSGVMKARWTEADRAAIFAGRLAFAPDDVLLMRRWLGSRCSARGADRRPVTARSGPGTAGRPD